MTSREVGRSLRRATRRLRYATPGSVRARILERYLDASGWDQHLARRFSLPISPQKSHP